MAQPDRRDTLTPPSQPSGVRPAEGPETRAGTEGRLFGSITSADIVEAVGQHDLTQYGGESPYRLDLFL